jgi:two-component system, OmpR family, response regulator
MREGEPEARLLVVEDEPNILELLSASLRLAGFEVATATGGARGAHGRPAAPPRPGRAGRDAARPGRLRRGPAAPLGRHPHPGAVPDRQGRTEDKVTGLTVGGDDYVTKPFSLEEVIARIRAVLRRARSGGPPPPPTRLKAADLELDEESHEVWRAGQRVQLSPTEFKLLRYLMTNTGRVLSKAQILDHVWNYDFRGDSSIVESYVSYLRRKVDAVEPRLIHTIRSVGYVLRLPAP